MEMRILKRTRGDQRKLIYFTPRKDVVLFPLVSIDLRMKLLKELTNICELSAGGSLI